MLQGEKLRVPPLPTKLLSLMAVWRILMTTLVMKIKGRGLLLRSKAEEPPGDTLLPLPIRMSQRATWWSLSR
jgi:hypothetical protein